ncbi:MAG: hypothetical protein PF795_01990 [Kiritimatiellae bacterium]|jgi:hypothetical protein|nr:hypothetical protein [Kiritimatiellia bacterium]
MKKVKFIAYILIAQSAIFILLYNLSIGTDKIVTHIVRLSLTCLLGYKLSQGRPWARTVTVILTGLAGLAGLATYPLMLGNAEALPFWLVHWSLTMGVLNTGIAFYLTFSKTVREECKKGGNL